MKKRPFTEEEILTIFAKEMKKRHIKLPSWNKILLLFLVFVIIMALSNFDAVYSQIKYWKNNDYADNNSSIIQNASVIKSTTVPDNTKKKYIPPIGDNFISIPAIEAYAPIAWGVENISEAVDKNLQNGVIQIKDSVLPGKKGNVFITGHSSNYVWSPGKYKSVFALLNKLVPGDTIQLKYKNKDYIYEVAAKKIVGPNETNVITDAQFEKQLTLMSCWPVGTALKRLIVTAKQIYPSPTAGKDKGNNEVVQPQTDFKALW